MAAEQGKRGFLERSAGFLERLNYALGAVAVAGAFVFPEHATGFLLFGALQFAEGAVWKWLKDRKARKQAAKAQPKLAAVTA